MTGVVPDAPAPSGRPAAFPGNRPDGLSGTTPTRRSGAPELDPIPSPLDEGETPPEPSLGSSLGPTIEPLPTQIVSAGYVVRLKILAHLDDGRPPRVTIDRLPPGANFDENPDGSHTLYWPTGDQDRGEYRFRITAVHPDDATRASGADALIIVGNPNGGISPPSEPFVAAPAALSYPPPGVTDELAATEGSGDVELDGDDRFRDDARDPYGTYDDHPVHDTQADFDITYDPQDPYAATSGSYFAASASDSSSPDDTSGETPPDDRGDGHGGEGDGDDYFGEGEESDPLR